MTKVRLKRKHLLFVSAGFIGLFLLIIFLIIPLVNQYQVDRMLQENKLQAGTEIIELIENATTTSRKLDLINKYMVSSWPRGNNHPIYISPGISMGEGTEAYWSGFTLDEIAPYLAFYIENSRQYNWDYGSAVNEYAHYIRKTEGAQAAIAFLLEKETEWKNHASYYFNEEFMLTRAQFLLEDGASQQAIDLLLQIKKEETERLAGHDLTYEPSESWTKLYVEALLRDKRLTEAYEFIEEWEEKFVLQRSEFEEDYQYYDENDYPLIGIKKRIEQMQADGGGKKDFGTVEGQIKRTDGTPLEDVYVYLRDSSNVNRSAHAEMDYYVTQTDENGYYHFQDVVPNSYQVGLGLQFHHVDGYSWAADMYDWLNVDYGTELTYDITFRPLMDVIQPVNNVAIVEDEMTFEWVPIEEAETYEVLIFVPMKNGGITFTAWAGIKETAITVPIHELWYLESSRSYSIDEDGNVILEPETLLGLANPEGQFSWSVRALDENGVEVGRSAGHRLKDETVGDIPFFQVKARELTAADRLLLKERLDEALAAYETDLEANSNDVHSLKMITEILAHKERGREHRIENEQYYYYMERLAELTGHPDYYFKLVEKAYRDKDWEDYDLWFGKYEQALSAKKGHHYFWNYNNYFHARALMERGLWEEAREWQYRALENDRSNEAVVPLFALEMYLGTDIETIVALAEAHPVKFRAYVDWTPYVKGVTVDAQMREALEIYLKQGAEALQPLLPTITDTNNQQFLEQLANHR
ncbi:carboxypeptidase-like regulatory domain-containing protein [Alkalihalobacterium chitinilyticum]|uniref:Carboxypeptidase-like regulatory domain-containing protein n=1 Tax=Alkalihalobacterium chitinilyticum TaxID=2980103 RepID=A0ABT5VH47_9BACI|nr:carboxypeptidase-like regulatory domain-containing protein [Alkalihalobacterium chitinilyticum]MDE5414072.1 carboxypeptidase-like regulatory domain-containing protein [Alkalihalobacterium chitinilyticum]